MDIKSFKTTEYEYKKELFNREKEIKEKEEKIKELTNQINTQNQTLTKLLNSKSWKVTKPLRRALTLLKKSVQQENLIVEKIKTEEEQYYKNFDAYHSSYQENKDFSQYKTDIKALAFYLPQYHTFPENDKWWGKGFMEWTNTKKALPRFEGHYQPRTPHKDIGYYTLDNIETIKKQVSLAKEHGLYGFCFYYYWFSGKRLMEKPLDLFLDNKDIDFPFCLCWANENWTRAWDGQQKDLLIKQDYQEKDPDNFIQDIKKYVMDKRYIKIDNKPLIMVYNPREIPNFKEVVMKWRKYAEKVGIGEIYILSKTDLADEKHEFTEYVDGEFDFPPQGIGHPATNIKGLPSPKIFNYQKIVDDIEHLYREHFPLKTFYYSCTMGWDNSARRKENYTVYYNYSLESYYKWLRIIIEETRRRNQEDKRFMFINAWNEWAEGTYLEPDEKYGYANINTLSKALFDLPLEKDQEKDNLNSQFLME